MTFLAFLLAAVVLALTPGPGIAYVVARTVAGGRSEGLASCLGTGLGGMLHVLAAALGLSLLIAQSAFAFSLVKYIGAAYLFYLGMRLLLRETRDLDVLPVSPRGARRALVEGVVVEVLNVKTALFFLAFLPQFINTSKAWVCLAIGGAARLFCPQPMSIITISGGCWSYCFLSLLAWCWPNVTNPKKSFSYF